jgi:hypothetical protein
VDFDGLVPNSNDHSNVAAYFDNIKINLLLLVVSFKTMVQGGRREM